MHIPSEFGPFFSCIWENSLDFQIFSFPFSKDCDIINLLGGRWTALFSGRLWPVHHTLTAIGSPFRAALIDAV